MAISLLIKNWKNIMGTYSNIKILDFSNIIFLEKYPMLFKYSFYKNALNASIFNAYTSFYDVVFSESISDDLLGIKIDIARLIILYYGREKLFDMYNIHINNSLSNSLIYADFDMGFDEYNTCITINNTYGVNADKTMFNGILAVTEPENEVIKRIFELFKNELTSCSIFYRINMIKYHTSRINDRVMYKIRKNFLVHKIFIDLRLYTNKR